MDYSVLHAPLTSCTWLIGFGRGEEADCFPNFTLTAFSVYLPRINLGSLFDRCRSLRRGVDLLINSMCALTRAAHFWATQNLIIDLCAFVCGRTRRGCSWAESSCSSCKLASLCAFCYFVLLRWVWCVRECEWFILGFYCPSCMWPRLWPGTLTSSISFAFCFNSFVVWSTGRGLNKALACTSWTITSNPGNVCAEGFRSRASTRERSLLCSLVFALTSYLRYLSWTVLRVLCYE